jgi:hypothetical protein
MADMYVVYVAAPDQEPSAEERNRLAELLRLDTLKLDTLLRRLPAEVTKPVPENTAVTVARRFREAGLDASIRWSEASVHSTSPASAPDPELDAELPAVEDDRAPGRSRDDAPTGDENIWKTQFGARERVFDTNEEHELFPRSAFAPVEGARAPSKPLVVALVTVLAVLAALWILL